MHIQLQSRNRPAEVVTNTNPHMIHYINSTNRIINLHVKVIAVKHFLVTRLASQIELPKFIQRTGNTAYNLAVRDEGQYLSCRALCLPVSVWHVSALGHQKIPHLAMWRCVLRYRITQNKAKPYGARNWTIFSNALPGLMQSVRGLTAGMRGRFQSNSWWDLRQTEWQCDKCLSVNLRFSLVVSS